MYLSCLFFYSLHSSLALIRKLTKEESIILFFYYFMKIQRLSYPRINATVKIIIRYSFQSTKKKRNERRNIKTTKFNTNKNSRQLV